MGDKVISEQIIETRDINGATVEIERIIWQSGGASFDVYDSDGQRAELLTVEESFDHIPDDDEIRALLAFHAGQNRTDPPEDANPCGVPEADTETEA